MGSRPFIIVPYRRPRRRWTRTGDYIAGDFKRRERRFRSARPQKQDRWFGPALVAIPFAAFIAVFAFDGPPRADALAMPPAAADRERASFALCDGPVRSTCVVDGDTLWYNGEKIRIADINTPETSEPHCAREAQLGRQATLRLQALLNSGPFTLEPNPDGRDTDKYGRSLRVITRGGESLGGALVSEGLAEYWKGYRGDWCR